MLVAAFRQPRGIRFDFCHVMGGAGVGAKGSGGSAEICKPPWWKIMPA